MALKGSIKEFGLSEIFQLIFHQNKEGRLCLTREQATISICFKDGKIIRAYEGERDQTLGEKLTKAEIITSDQLIIAKYKQENTKKSLEGVLVDLDLVPAEELKRLNRLFTEETIYKVFDWHTGEYAFEQKDISFNPKLVQAMDTQFILMESVRQIDEWPLLLKKVTSRKAVFEKTETGLKQSTIKKEEKKEIQDAEDFFGDLGESEEEEEEGDWLLDQINGQQNVQQIIDKAQLGSFAVYQGLVGLLSKKVIREKKEAYTEDEASLESSFRISRLNKEKALKILTGSLISLITIGIYTLSIPSLQQTTLKAARSFQSVKTLSEQNQRYFIRFALDLYYLKYNRYPETLDRLVQEGLFGKKEKVIQNLKFWTYRLETGDKDKFKLQYKNTN